MHFLKKGVLLFTVTILAFICTSCGAAKLKARKENLQKLEIGISYNKAIELMGKTNIGYDKQVGDYLFKYYPASLNKSPENNAELYTKLKKDRDTEYWITLCFRDDRLVSWGENRCKEIVDNDKSQEEFKSKVSFRGIVFGIPLEKQMPVCPTFTKTAQNCYSNYKYGQKLIDNLPDIGILGFTFVNLTNGNVSKLKFIFHHGQADDMLNLMKQKYGDPYSIDTSTVQNRMGAQFDKFEAKWNVKDCILILTDRYEKVDEGALHIMSEEHLDNALDKKDTDTQKALKNM